MIKSISLAIRQIRRNLSGSLHKTHDQGAHDQEVTTQVAEPPFRSEIFSIEQLERHAHYLAAIQVVAIRPSEERLLTRLDENERVLVEAYGLISDAVDQTRRIEPAAEWLLDNFYLVEDQIRETRQLLPKSFSNELPQLSNTSSAHTSRAYAIAIELISHTDGRVDAPSLNGFIKAYQSVTSLKIGELWALPLMLRLALIENLRRVAGRLTQGRIDRNLAADWSSRMIDAVERAPSDLVLVLADLARSNPYLSGAFLADLTRQLQAQPNSFAIAITWIEQRLAMSGKTIEQLVQDEGQNQAADQVSVGNSIGSLRFLSNHDWRQFVTEQSLIEQTLHGDPAGIYSNMDFETRNRYRHAVEAIAKRSQFSEYEVARRAVQLAQTEAVNPARLRSAHVGYFLIDRGRPALEQFVHMRMTPSVVIEKIRRASPLTMYLMVVSVLAITAAFGLVCIAPMLSVPMAVWLGLLFPLAMCLAQFGISFANWMASYLVRPITLPRMDFREGIPSDFRTLIAIPTMLSSLSAVERLLEALELRFLSNRDSSLHFALVTDLPDANVQTLATDSDLIAKARLGIERLNDIYASEQRDRFFLFHRARTWNDQEKVWMGYERKRGKLADLNATLRGAKSRFAEVVGNTSALAGTQYVLTLDSDTQLPSDSARMMIEAMAHPLNRPMSDPDGERIVDGYSILQPRVGISPSSAQQSAFVQCFSEEGVDPYTHLVSDLYQDLFQEGSFIGKGIYDIDAFEKQCSVFPENMILSHDLIEGCYARSGVVSDVILYEEFPANYSADASRRHRWVRGDWQIAAWLLPIVRDFANHRSSNKLNWLSFWKILDNLRRSLMPASMLAVLVVGWLFTSTWIAAVLTMLIIVVVATPHFLAACMDLLRKVKGVSLRTHCVEASFNAFRSLKHFLLAIVFLPYDTYINLDAIVRTLVRVHWTRRRLLEWKTSGDSERSACQTIRDFYESMSFAPASAFVIAILLLIARHESIFIALPFLALWIASPLVAWKLSQPIVPAKIDLSDTQRNFLHTLARRTWHYFETFVTESDHWLPPDNVSFNGSPMVASRTSPTNIGIALLSDLSAVDFGYCSIERFLIRTERTFATLTRMERFRGHFFNWYDTRTLAPLIPRYVSTVDSGNLLGYLRILSSGIREFADSPPRCAAIMSGLRDTLQIQLEEATKLAQGPSQNKSTGISGAEIRKYARKLESILAQLTTRVEERCEAISLLTRVLESFQQLPPLSAEHPEVAKWQELFVRECNDHLEEQLRFSLYPETPMVTEAFWAGNSPEQAARRAELRQLVARFDSMSSPRELAALPETILPRLDTIEAQDGFAEQEWFNQLRVRIAIASDNAAKRVQWLDRIATTCDELAEMDFEFLKSKTMKLFAIGFNASENCLDNSCYDLLASEARLATFVLISQGAIDQSHWFALGRLLTNAAGATALLSWSGSMFEYLMPLLVMPSYEHTLLDQTYRAVVRRQIRYGRQRNVPWGISESGYNATDLHLNYQYRAFGVPGLGLKRGLAEDLVIAPYASALALMVEPDAACRNLERLTSEGRSGEYGLFEAIDYTPSRMPTGVSSVTVRQVMAHHSGMSLLSIAYVLLDKPMQRRFQLDPMLRSSDLLLHERIPRASVLVYPHVAEANATRSASAEEAGTMRVFTDPNSSIPDVHLLSNGHYHVAISSAGGGYSRLDDIAITRWREDATRDCWGSFCYLRDVDSGTVWSTAYQPTHKPSKNYEAIFTHSRAEFRRKDEEIETYTMVAVASDDNIELRRTKITNRSDRKRTIEITSYSEVVLAPQANDESHPSFSNLFVQSEILAERNAIVCTRRPRSANEKPPWLIHMLSTVGKVVGEPSFESDRMRFLGRGRSISNPHVMEVNGRLSNSQGSTLDPIVSIRQRFLIQPNESVEFDLVTGVAETREQVIDFAAKYSDPHLTDRLLELAWTRGPILLQQLNISEADAQTFGRLAGSIIYASAARRAKASVLIKNRRGQSGLWSYGISGDLPIALVRIRDIERLDIVRQSIQAHSYWRMKGLAVDLVIWNEDDSVYRQSLQEAINDILTASPEAALIDRPGGIFIRRGEQMSEEDRLLLQTVARVVILDDAGSLADQANRRARLGIFIPDLKPTKRLLSGTANINIASSNTVDPSHVTLKRDDLTFFNGFGGFSKDGREYVICQSAEQSTPAPWVNVIANEHIGTVVSESGSSYTWTGNSHEFRLTPWNNDPVSDTCGEAIYIRDEETGQHWSPSPAPSRGKNAYTTRHGFGYSIFDYSEDGIVTELCLYVAIDAPVKFAKLKISNRSGRVRLLSITGYWEWVLGELRGKSLMHISTEIDPVTHAMFARNPFSPEFAEQIAFVDCSEGAQTFTGDRSEFIGRNGTLSQPAAMKRARLSNRTGAGMDPCAALQTQIQLEDQQEKTIVFTIGSGKSESEVRQLVQRFRGVGNAYRAIEGVWHFWSQTLGALYIETPDTSVNFLANGWLLYQTLSCRLWARSGFYQSGGAYGFRDQLQDAMALIHSQPQLLREHLLRAAAHQFREGDVQHWWHPPAGRGVRTHFSDDYLWLPLALCRYVRTTGDLGILEERIVFLTARALRADEESNYDLPQVSNDTGTLYEHALRAMDHGLRFGSHGLPLMGCGDWNDGMNLVGQHGKGESVWLGFFLFDLLIQFSDLAEQRQDTLNAERYRLEAGRLRGNIEEHAWDGQWYRRAYFDDGTPLGSATNDECQIDSLSQSWSILSGAGTQERAIMAMNSIDKRLVRRNDRLIQLLDPPFDSSSLNPGYIKGYVPGVRENGGQYTHGAIWTVMAFAMMGDNERAWELFRLINPISHGSTPESIAKYRVEPYVIAADVYGVDPHIGRGGWTWYTGSAGWMYRLITESLLGLKLDVDKLRFEPRLPSDWSSYKIHYRYRETFYHITFHRNVNVDPKSFQSLGTFVQSIHVDDTVQSELYVHLVDDRIEHFVEIELA